MGDGIADVLYDLIMQKSQALQNIIPQGERTQDKENKFPVERYDDLWCSTRGSIRYFTNIPGVKVTAVMRKIRKSPQVKHPEKAEKLGWGKGTAIKYKEKTRFLVKIEKKLVITCLRYFEEKFRQDFLLQLNSNSLSSYRKLWIWEKKLNWLWDRQVICLSIR